jgi:hypothetical protein
MKNYFPTSKALFIILFSLMISPSLLQGSTSQGKTEISKDMVGIHANMQNLFPLAAKNQKLNNKDMEIVSENITSLKKHVDHLKGLAEDKSDTFKISQEMLNNHLENVQASLQNNEDEYALSLIREIPHLCSSCHTQDEQTMHFDSSKIKEQLKTDFLRGEYHFMTRDYQEALLDFNDHLAKQKKIRHGQGNTEAMEKILLIYLQIFRDTNNASMYFERLLNSEKLSAGLAIDVNHWLHSLSEIQYTPATINDIELLEKEVVSVLNFRSDSEMPVFIDEENKVGALWVRASIYDFMNRNPKHADTAKLLYWLASFESALDYGLNYQLPEIYLKHCIISYPKHPYAKKCFDQYNLHTEFQYTGSSGTHLPLYKKLELESLENKLKN